MKIKSAFINVLKYITIILFSLSILFIILNPKLYNRPTFTFNVWLVILFAVLISGIIAGLYILIKKYYAKKGFDVYLKTGLGILSIGVFILQLFYIYKAHIPIGWDAGVMMKHASGVQILDSYFLVYYNNVFLCAILTKYLEIFSTLFGGDYWLAADILNVIAIDIAIINICIIAYKHIGKKVFFITYILSIICLAFVPQIFVPYSDTFGMFFLSIVLLIGFETIKIDDGKNLLPQLLALSFFGVLSYMIKPTAVFIAVLFFVFIVIKNLRNNKEKKGILILICVVAILIGYIGGTNIYTISEDTVFEGEYTAVEKYLMQIPLTHYFMMGINIAGDESCDFGSYSPNDFKATLDIYGKDEKVKYNKEEIKRRIDDMGISIVPYYFNKYIWFTTEGTFNYHEGYEVNPNEDEPLYKRLTNNQSDLYTKIYANYLQALWLIVLILCLVSSISKENYKDKRYIILNISIICLLGFITTFEARSRYLLIYMPVYILMAGYGFEGILRGIFEIIPKIKDISRKHTD